MNRNMRSRGHKERHDIKDDDDDFWSQTLTNAGALVQVRACSRKLSAWCVSGQVFCVHSPSRAWQLLLPERETLRKKSN